MKQKTTWLRLGQTISKNLGESAAGVESDESLREVAEKLGLSVDATKTALGVYRGTAKTPNAPCPLPNPTGAVVAYAKECGIGVKAVISKYLQMPLDSMCDYIPGVVVQESEEAVALEGFIGTMGLAAKHNPWGSHYIVYTPAN